MSNTALIIEERAANIGNFMVGRLLHFRKKDWIEKKFPKIPNDEGYVPYPGEK